MNVFSTTYCSIAVALSLALGANAAEVAREPSKQAYSLNEVNGFLRAPSLDKMKKDIQDWLAGPLYLKPALLEELAGHVTPSQKRETRDYSWEKGTHDMNQPAGRAAWAVESLTGIDLAKVTPTSSEAEIQKIRGQAEKLIEAYNAGILAMALEIKPEKPLDELKGIYHGKIKHGVPSNDFQESFKLMSELLEQWFPLGKKLSELEDIIGSPGTEREKSGGVEYRFKGGWNVILYRLKIDDGIIVSVAILGA